ncbi:hypothetical protein [Peterkaempfera griseoplana]|uniref:hypothetical protein n=1 Tax=Peterkaempfera griseoplana TaxID=66896 RepID=UPI0006E44527|nr:hypothetical protein [Peterkaempfera griseoplana]
MLRLRTAHRSVAMTTAALALAGGATIGLGGATGAQAAVRPATCTWINIGTPGNYTLNGVYAGQVEQQYNGCGTARAHWQWSTAYRTAHPNARVTVSVESWTVPVVSDTPRTQYASASADAYSYGADIHSANPDEWFADAAVIGDDGATCRYSAGGSVHAYANGSEIVAASPSSC